MRVKDQAYLRKIRATPCLVCNRWAQAHHLMHAEPSAMGKRSGDNWAVPLCSYHHEALHRYGNEAEWWAIHGIDPIAWAENNYDRKEEQ